MTTAWAHLPNAALIDAVLADAKARPDAWLGAWRATWGAAHTPSHTVSRYDARTAIREAGRTAVRIAARTQAWDALRDKVSAVTAGTSLAAVRLGAWDAILALIAWDDCAYLLDLPSTTLRTTMDLCDAPVCHQAGLLWPYVLVKEGTPTDLT